MIEEVEDEGEDGKEARRDLGCLGKEGAEEF